MSLWRSLSFDIYQLSSKSGKTRRSEGPSSYSASRRRLQRHSVLSKPSFTPSRLFTRISKFVHDPTQNTFLMNPSAGHSRRQEKDPRPLLTHDCIGDDFRSACRQCDGAGPPGQVVTVRFPPHPFRPNPEFLPVSLRTSEGNCNLCPRSRGCGDLPTMFKTTKRFQSFSNICGGLSPTTRFVRGFDTALDSYEDNRWCNEWRSMSKDAN